MEALQQVTLEPRRLEPLADVYGASEMENVRRSAARLSRALNGGVIWHVSSTARGGGVAEMLSSHLSYARGARIDARWLVIGGRPDFFRLTKRLHNAIHGSPGDDGCFDAYGRAEYEEVMAHNAAQMLPWMSAQDVVVLHDPQTLGLAPLVAQRGVQVIWRCHIGTEVQNPHTEAAFAFLAPYLKSVRRAIFSRSAFVPPQFPVPVFVLAPTIDPFSAKNQPLSPEVVHAILAHTGLLDAPTHGVAPEFRRRGGSIGQVARGADVIRSGPVRSEETRIIVQVSRWDWLKDHVGVLEGFAMYAEQGGDVHLVLAGPNVHAVADDPEGAEVFDEVLTAYRALPPPVRGRVELVNLPMADVEENAAIVNALQRQATVLVQKSLQEGFGLTVTEAMWKAKPVIGSRVGGIPDQIEHGVSGLLLDDPLDYRRFSELLGLVTSDPELAERLGVNANERVKERFLSLRSLYFYADLISHLLEVRHDRIRTAVQVV